MCDSWVAVMIRRGLGVVDVLNRRFLMYDSKTDEYEELSGVYSTAEMGWEDWEWVERHWRKAPWTESEAAHERESKKMIESNESIEELEVPISGFLFCVQESIEMVLQDLIGIYNKTRGKKTIQVTDPNSTMEIQSRNWWVELNQHLTFCNCIIIGWKDPSFILLLHDPWTHCGAVGNVFISCTTICMFSFCNIHNHSSRWSVQNLFFPPKGNL